MVGKPTTGWLIRECARDYGRQRHSWGGVCSTLPDPASGLPWCQMGDQIFTVGPSGFQALDPEAYQGEAELQKLLAAHPELLAVERRRWLLIRREVPVPADQGGSNKWSLDHLFLDDEAIPTFIETKLATNAGIRREVVGQMLDYAANGSVYWPIKQIRAWFEDTVNSGGGNADSVLAAFLGDGLEPHAFWEQAVGVIFIQPPRSSPHAATIDGAGLYELSSPPSLLRHSTLPTCPTGSDRAIGVLSSRARCGRSSL